MQRVCCGLKKIVPYVSLSLSAWCYYAIFHQLGGIQYEVVQTNLYYTQYVQMLHIKCLERNGYMLARVGLVSQLKHRLLVSHVELIGTIIILWHI